MTRYDLAVIGMGAMGCSVCYQAARRGASVIGTERYLMPHKRGSSHGGTRIIRLNQPGHGHYTPLAMTALELWRRIQEESGEEILSMTGGIYVGPPNGNLVGDGIRAADRHGIGYELLDHAQLNERYPQFSVPKNYVAVYEDSAGILYPERILLALVREARKRDADVLEDTMAERWERTGGSYVVHLDDGEVRANAIALCAGPWTADLARIDGFALRVTRQVVIRTRPADPPRFELGRFPVWRLERPDGGGNNGFPVDPETGLFKAGDHDAGPPLKPDEQTLDAAPEEYSGIAETLREFLPGAYGPVVSVEPCLYSHVSGGHMVVGLHPEHEGVVYCCGFHGEGFKFASAIGLGMAEVALTGKTEVPLSVGG